MAGVKLHATSGEVQLVPNGNPKTILQIAAAAGHRVRIAGWGVSIKGTGTTDVPVLVSVVRQTSIVGTGMTNITTTNLVKKNDADPETIQSLLWQGALTNVANTAEPTFGSLVEEWEIQPQTGQRMFYPPGDELWIPNGERLGFRTTTAGLSYACDFEVDLEE